MPRNANAAQMLTHLSMELPYSGINLSVNPGTRVELIQEPNSHDIAEIYLPNQRFSGIRDRLAYGAPVSFEWKCPTGNQAFLGHIHSVKPWIDSTNGTMIRAVSAGFPLKKMAQRIWTQTTASSVASLLAAEHGLTYDVEPHSRVFPQIAQRGQSEWAVLRELAEKIGYSLRMEGVTLQFVSKSTLARYYRPMAPTVTVSNLDSMVEPGLRDILLFSPNFGEVQPEGDESLAVRRLATVDQAGHPVAYTSSGVRDLGRSTKTPVYDRYINEVSRTAQEAHQIVQDASERARYPVKAEAEMYGDPRIAPNRVVLVKGAANNLDGYWTVTRSHHHIVTGSGYTMTLTLGAEGLGEERMSPGLTQTSVPVAGLLKTPYASAVLIRDSAVGATGRWAPSR